MMGNDRKQWAKLRGMYTVIDPTDLPALLRHAETCTLHRQAVAAAIEQWDAWTDRPLPPELLRFACRALRGDLPPARQGRTPVDHAFRNFALAGAVRDLVDQGVQKGAAEQLVAEREGMKADAVRRAIKLVRTFRAPRGN